jgi:hypothetical protein
MARWSVAYWRSEEGDADAPDGVREMGCFRVFPEGEPERWIAQTNPDLPLEVQEEFALQIAEALFNLLGV